MIAINTWRICGPFNLSTSDNYVWYSPERESEALNHDYLRAIGGEESPLPLKAPTTDIKVNFYNDVKNEVKGKDGPPPPYKPFIDQVQAFPASVVSSQILYWNFPKRFSISYAAAALSSPASRDVVFIVSSNSPLKIWLDGRVIANPSPGSVGHSQTDYYILRAHLREGKNPLLVKMFTFPERNEFSFRVATPAQSRKFLDDNATYLDLLDQVIIPRDRPLPLAGNLQYLAVISSYLATVEIVGANGRVVRSQRIDLRKTHELQTLGIPQGIYDLHLRMGAYRLSETFFLGDVNDVLTAYKVRCINYQAKPDAFNPCVILKPLVDRMADRQMTERLDKEKPMLLLLSQLEWSEQGVTAESPLHATERHVYLQSFRSKIDGTLQYYYVHLPPEYFKKLSVPLVVICPYDDRQKLFLVGPTNTLALNLQQYAFFADKYGLAFIVPYARGVGMSNFLGLRDVVEALDDAQRRYRIDANRIYLTGDCAGGRGALLLAEHYPRRFAAISTVNASTGLRYGGSGLMDDGLSSHIRNLSKIPIRLIHGQLYPHSPTAQAFTFLTWCKHYGFQPELILLPGDGSLGEHDPVQLSFEFFQGKSLSVSRRGDRLAKPRREIQPSV